MIFLKYYTLVLMSAQLIHALIGIGRDTDCGEELEAFIEVLVIVILIIPQIIYVIFS